MNMASNSTYFWRTAYSCANPFQHQELEEHDSLEKALLAALNHDYCGSGEHKVVIYFP